MLDDQGGVCAICGKPEIKERTPGVVFHLSVDHVHDTGKIRGLLCCKCNRFIGLAGEDIAILSNAIGYLKKTGG